METSVNTDLWRDSGVTTRRGSRSCTPEVAISKAVLPAVDLASHLSVFACLSGDQALVGRPVRAKQHVGGSGCAAQSERDAVRGEWIDSERGVADRHPSNAGAGLQLVARAGHN